MVLWWKWTIILRKRTWPFLLCSSIINKTGKKKIFWHVSRDYNTIVYVLDCMFPWSIPNSFNFMPKMSKFKNKITTLCFIWQEHGDRASVESWGIWICIKLNYLHNSFKLNRRPNVNMYRGKRWELMIWRIIHINTSLLAAFLKATHMFKWLASSYE
jgi:hypothetical protein